ncbi:MAG: DUF447 family protein [Planctomycetaceae bacterium]|nr:DUF447 family protein [Planctomycetaceae bacterium]
MIIEGLTTTTNADGTTNVAPMGPIVIGDFLRLQFRPFPGSLTYENLKRTRRGVFHVTDDVLLLVQAALDLPHSPPPLQPAMQVEGAVLKDCCRWYEFAVESVVESGERPVMDARVVHTGRSRDFVGFNRARHAVIEAAIAASRLEWLGREAVEQELARCRGLVEKTGDAAELQAFDLVAAFVHKRAMTNRQQQLSDQSS